LLGVRGIDTIAPANIEAILATKFNGVNSCSRFAALPSLTNVAFIRLRIRGQKKDF